MTLVAKWNINSYTLTLGRNNSKAGSISNNSGSHNYNESITIIATTNPGYTFDGWYNGSTLLTEKTSYTFNMPANALSYTAKWTANTDTAYKVEHYLQNLDNTNYPSTPFEIDNLTGTTDTLTNGTVNTYEGFTSPSITQSNINGNGSTVIKLYYTRNSYTVSLDKNIDEAGTITGVGTYKYGKEITLTATTYSGYTFDGWYDDSLLVSDQESYTFELSANNLSYTAIWIVNQYTITIDNQAASDGIVVSGVTSGNKYVFDSQITLLASNIPNGYTIRWSRSDEEYGKVLADSYSFFVPSYDITFTVEKSKFYIREENKIYFGTYPQTEVEATAKNGLASITFDSSTWTKYQYYASSTISEFMYYKDVDLDNNGTYDFRGVYISKYRPYMCSYSTGKAASYQDENGYLTKTIYWFSYDPIEWNILSESNDEVLIIANLILDSQEYYSSTSSETTKFEHNGGKGYGNNYELSNIRKFLNDNFYSTAFNDYQKELIKDSFVDNSASSTSNDSNIYACNNTQDKLFLLSYFEATTYFATDLDRQSTGTDYARCQGLRKDDASSSTYLEYNYWWLRSPRDTNAYNARYVYDSGYISSRSIGYTNCGVRPACWINL